MAIIFNIIPELIKNKRQKWLIDRIKNGCENIYTEEYYTFDHYLKSGEFLNDDMDGYILGGILILKGIVALTYAIVDFNTFILKSKDILSIGDSECDELMTRIKSETDTQMLMLMKMMLILWVLLTFIFGNSMLLLGILIILMTYESLYSAIRNGKISRYLGV